LADAVELIRSSVSLVDKEAPRDASEAVGWKHVAESGSVVYSAAAESDLLLPPPAPPPPAPRLGSPSTSGLLIVGEVGTDVME
jgi:hypothetical protein